MKPWVKYANQGQPSSLSEQNTSAVDKLVELFFGKPERVDKIAADPSKLTDEEANKIADGLL